MDILDLLRLLWRNKWLLLATGFSAALLTVIFVKYKKDHYESVARISTGYTLPNPTGTQDRFEVRDAEVKFSNLIALLNSPTSFNLLSYQLLLHDLDSPRNRFRDPEPAPLNYLEPGTGLGDLGEKILEKIERVLGAASGGRLYTGEEATRARQIIEHKADHLLPLDTDDPDYKLIRKFYMLFRYTYTDVRKHLTIERVPNTDYVQIKYESENNDLSAYAANTFCREFIRYYGSLVDRNSDASVTYLQQAVEQKKSDLDNKLETLRLFRSSNGLLNVEQAGATRMSQLTSLESERNEILSKLEQLDLTIQHLKGQLAAVSEPTVNGDNQRIIQLQTRVNDLNAAYLADGSRNKTLLDSVDVLRDQMRLLISTLNGAAPAVSADELREQIEQAGIDRAVERKRLSLVGAKLRELQLGLSGYASRGARITAMQNEVDATTREYTEMLSKFNQAKRTQTTANTLQQVLIAIPAASPASMRKLYVVGLAAVGGVAIAIFMIMLRGITDRTIRHPSRFKQIIGIPSLGALVMLRREPGVGGQETAMLDGKGVDRLAVHQSLLRQVRFEIESLGGRVLLFTSLKPSEGKTFVMIELSYVLSLLGKRVLIIDTNFKSNSLTKRFLSPSNGGVGGQRGKRSGWPAIQVRKKPNGNIAVLEQADYAPVNSTRFKNIYFAGNSGVSTKSPSEILATDDFRNFVSRMSAQFDYVLLEGASLDQYADTKELITYVDKVIAVVAADSVLEPIDEASISYLQSLGDKLGGAVLNKVDPKDISS